MSASSQPAILVLGGPNLGMLGIRQPQVYGSSTYDDVVAECHRAAAARGARADVRQTDDEAQLLGWIHDAARSKEFSAIVINPAAWTHTSVAVADALVIPEIPVIEVHLSNVYAREPFRKHSYVSPIAAAVISGCGLAGYGYAIDRAVELATS